MGLNPIKHCVKFEVCKYVMKYWEYFLNWLRMFVVVYEDLIGMCLINAWAKLDVCA